MLLYYDQMWGLKKKVNHEIMNSAVLVAEYLYSRISKSSFLLYSLSDRSITRILPHPQYSLFLNNTTAVAASNMFFQANVALLTTRSPGSNTILTTLKPSDIITVRPTAVVGVVSYGNPNLVVKKIF